MWAAGAINIVRHAQRLTGVPEDVRHERERQQSLEDERRKRREDRYVSLLSELIQLDRTLDGLCELLPLLAEDREKRDSPQSDPLRETRAATAEVIARKSRQGWSEAEEQHRAVTDAVLTAHGVASPSVRKQGVLLTDWPMAITGVHVALFTIQDFRFNVIMEEAGPREVGRAEYAEYLVDDIQDLRRVIAELDRLLRAELALD
jgi:hypothetical protein